MSHHIPKKNTITMAQTRDTRIIFRANSIWVSFSSISPSNSSITEIRECDCIISFVIFNQIKIYLVAQRKWSPLPDLNCSLVVDDLRQLLHEVAKNAKLELMRGNDQAVKELLDALLQPEDKFSKVEKKIVVNQQNSCKGSQCNRVYPITNPLNSGVTL